MNYSYINKRDRIIASAIEIISKSGITSLTTKNLAMRENMTEDSLYRYFGNIEEVLEEVVNTFTKFDNSIIATAKAKDIPHLERVLEFLMNLSIYYKNYYEIAAIPLNYEIFLHNVNTRDKIAACIKTRTDFLINELNAAIEAGEIVDTYTPEELTTIFYGTVNRDLLNRRIFNKESSHDQVTRSIIEKIADSIRIKPDSK